MLAFLLLSLAQLTLRHDVVPVSPTELLATVSIENPTPERWRNATVYSGIAPPGTPIAVYPAPTQTIPVPPGLIHVWRLGDLGPFGRVAAQVRVRVPEGLGWAHPIVVDVEPERTSVPRYCRPSVAGPTPQAVPTLAGFGLSALTLLLCAGLLFQMERRKRAL